MKNLAIQALTLLILLTACTGTPLAITASPAPTEIDTPILTLPTLTVTPISNLTSTPTALIANPTSIVATTPTPPPEARLEIQCLDLLPQLPATAASNGVVLVENRRNGAGLLVNMMTGSETLLTQPNESMLLNAVSPDKTLMAYSRVMYDKPGGKIIQHDLVIATADGQSQAITPWEEGWVGTPNWLDNERLIINIAGKDPDEDAGLKPATLMVLNPFKGERQILGPDFPDIFDDSPMVNWESWGATVYNSTLTRVVYARHQLGKPDPGYTLWNLQTQEAMATIPAGLFDHMPRWSPDDSRFIVATNDVLNAEKPWMSFELYSVDSDSGQITQLTNLTAYYPAVYIQDYAWSPDGRYVAFWLFDLQEDSPFIDRGEGKLAILDTTTNQVTNLCIPSYYAASSILGPLRPPVWSPDGQQLVVEIRYSRADQASQNLLVDLAQGWAAPVMEDTKVVGWVKVSR